MQNDDDRNCNCNCDITEDSRYAVLKEYIDSLHGARDIGVLVLQKAQSIFGYLPLEVHKFISENTGIPIAELYGVSTFYSQFTLKPKGKHHIAVCLGTACYVKGGKKVADKVAETLHIEIGDTTPDGLFTLDSTRCLGCCGLSPVMMIDNDIYAKLDDVETIPAILDKYRE